MAEPVETPNGNGGSRDRKSVFASIKLSLLVLLDLIWPAVAIAAVMTALSYASYYLWLTFPDDATIAQGASTCLFIMELAAWAIGPFALGFLGHLGWNLMARKRSGLESLGQLAFTVIVATQLFFAFHYEPQLRVYDWNFALDKKFQNECQGHARDIGTTGRLALCDVRDISDRYERIPAPLALALIVYDTSGEIIRSEKEWSDRWKGAADTIHFVGGSLLEHLRQDNFRATRVFGDYYYVVTVTK